MNVKCLKTIRRNLSCIILLIFVMPLGCSSLYSQEKTDRNISLKPSSKQCYEGEQISVTLQYENRTDEEWEIIRPLASRMPANVDIVIKDQNNKKLDLKRLGRHYILPGFPEYDHVKKDIPPKNTWSLKIPLSVYYDLHAYEKGKTYAVSVKTNNRTVSCKFNVSPVAKKEKIQAIEVEHGQNDWQLPKKLTAKMFWAGVKMKEHPEKLKWILAYREQNPWAGGWIRLSSAGKDAISDTTLIGGKRIWKRNEETPKYMINHHYRKIPYKKPKEKEPVPNRKVRPANTTSKRPTMKIRKPEPARHCTYIAVSWIEDSTDVRLFVRGRYLSPPGELYKRGINNMPLYGLRLWRYGTLFGPGTIFQDKSLRSLTGMDVENGLIVIRLKKRDGSTHNVTVDEEGKIIKK